MGKLVLLFSAADIMGGLGHMGGWGWVRRNSNAFCSIGGPIQNPIKIGRLGLLIPMEFSHRVVGRFLPALSFTVYDLIFRNSTSSN